MAITQNQVQHAKTWLAQHSYSCPACRSPDAKNCELFGLPMAIRRGPGLDVTDMVGVICGSCAYVSLYGAKAMGLPK